MHPFKVYLKDYRTSIFIKKVGHFVSFKSFALLAGGVAITRDFDIKAIHVGLIIVIGLFFVHLSAFLIIAFGKFNADRKSLSHGELIVQLSDHFSKIHAVRGKYRLLDMELAISKNENEKMSLKEKELKLDQASLFALETICESLQKHFCKKTNSECCVSIKLLKDVRSDTLRDTVVYNAYRDEEHKSRNTKKYLNLRHAIKDNTPFDEIAEKIQKVDTDEYCHFLHGDINNDPYYKNTSKELYKNGKLPYNSELVVPLAPPNELGQDLIGFLCVDSKKKNRFGKKYDLPVLKGVADGIYDVILRRDLN